MSSTRPTRAIGRALITAGGLSLLAAAYQRLQIGVGRARTHTNGERAGIVAMEVGSLVMERNMLYGIEQRAEAGAPANSDARSKQTLDQLGDARDGDDYEH
jgi:hypothetical protein